MKEKIYKFASHYNYILIMDVWMTFNGIHAFSWSGLCLVVPVVIAVEWFARSYFKGEL